ILMTTIGNLSAQTMEQVVEKYNTAAQLINTDAAGAVKNLEEAVKMADIVGEEAEQIKVMAESQLPAMYFKLAGELYKEKKNDQSIEVFEKSIIAGELYNDPGTVARAKDILGKLYFAQGNNHYRAAENDKAIEALNRSLVYEPNNARVQMLLGLIYRKSEDLENMTASMDQAIALAKVGDDEQTQSTCEKSMRDYLAVRANRNIQANKNSDALELLQKATKYGDDAQTYYLLALAHNRIKQYDSALESAQTALALETDNASEKAKIWFEIGNAHKEKGNSQEACDAYRNAAHGNFAEAANYQRQQVLKCN
ncbi:MAG: tetratricopeptide repeat protein, partial [Bacteroidales bacterium]|nr:tetratricopeptide repeat protein [Bacteroidales bacterium]